LELTGRELSILLTSALGGE